MLKKYWVLLRTVFGSIAIYRLNIFTSIIATIIGVIALRELWSTLLQDTSYIDSIGVTKENMLNYVTLSMILQALYSPKIFWEISAKIHTGDIAHEFSRPWDYQLSVLSRLFGMILSNLVTVVLPILVITVLIFPISVPLSLETWIAFIISICFGVLINFSIQFFIGLLSFIFVEIWGFDIMVGLLISFMSGRLIPIWMFPEALNKIAQFLPFKGLFDTPLSIYLGISSSSQYLELLLIQGAWVLVLFLGIRFLLFRFQRLVTVAGG